MSLARRYIPVIITFIAGTALADDLEQRLAASEARLTALEQQNNTDWDLRQLTRAGVRISADINERTAVVVRFLARGEEDFNTEVQWAFLAYTISPDLVRGQAGANLTSCFGNLSTQIIYSTGQTTLDLPVTSPLVVALADGCCI